MPSLVNPLLVPATGCEYKQTISWNRTTHDDLNDLISMTVSDCEHFFATCSHHQIINLSGFSHNFHGRSPSTTLHLHSCFHKVVELRKANTTHFGFVHDVEETHHLEVESSSLKGDGPMDSERFHPLVWDTHRNHALKAWLKNHWPQSGHKELVWELVYN